MMNQHILLAGGKENLRHSISLMLKQAEYRVSLAGTVQEALALIHTLRNSPAAVDLLITDLDFASSGPCRDLLASVSAGNVTPPFLIIVEDVEERTADILKKHGCLACITRPFEPETLLGSIRTALDRSPA
jgi:DNA-binding NtrC family response regulator